MITKKEFSYQVVKVKRKYQILSEQKLDLILEEVFQAD